MTFNLTKDQIEIQARAREIASTLVAQNAVEVDKSEQYPWDNVKALTDAGFVGMTIPKAYGGPGRNFLEANLVVEEMAAYCGPTGRIAVEANMGAISAVMQYGTDFQKRLAADLVLAGDKPAICITEPDAGSAASQMTTRADKRGDKYVINGKKHWITGGGVSKLHLIFARVFDENNIELGIGGFLAVRGEADGLKVGAREPTMGLRGIPETELIFEDLEVAENMVLMPPSGFKRGFADLMNAYNSQRVGAGTVALGLAVGAYRNALEFAKEREQFGRPIGSFQAIQHYCANMATDLEGARIITYRAAWKISTGRTSAMESSLAKSWVSSVASRLVYLAHQSFGAIGFTQDHDLQLFTRRLKAGEMVFGDEFFHNSKIADFLGL